VLDEIVITVEDDGNPPRFRLAEDDAPPRLASAVVTELGVEAPIWWIVPAAFSVAFPVTAEEITPEEVEDLADSEPFDPIEDLPPSDPRHRAAIEGRDQVNDRAFPVLGSLTYGIVPTGFRQAATQADIAALVPGRSYGLTVIGPGGHGSVLFQVK